MENISLYSHYLGFDKVVDIIRQEMPKAKLEVSDSGTSLTATSPGGLLGKSKTLKINYRQRKNPSYKLDKIECAVTQQLAGLVGYIQKMPAMDENIKSRLIIKAMAVNAEIGFIGEPEFTAEFTPALKRILTDLDAFVFTPPNNIFKRSGSQHFADKNLKVILDGYGHSDISDLEVNVESRYHDQPADEYTKEQLDRKAASENFLVANGIKVNKNLPCVPDSKTVKLRNINEVVDRAYALVTLAAKGEGVEQPNLERVIADKKIVSFSPLEREWVYAATLTDEQRALATWRYESLYVILWSLGKTEDLKYPSNICDVGPLVESIIRPSREEFTNTVKLKSVESILDELDKTYRMHWACVDANIKGIQPGNIFTGIVYERHYALNWLTSYEDQDWDDVQTDT